MNEELKTRIRLLAEQLKQVGEEVSRLSWHHLHLLEESPETPEQALKQGKEIETIIPQILHSKAEYSRLMAEYEELLTIAIRDRPQKDR